MKRIPVSAGDRYGRYTVISEAEPRVRPCGEKDRRLHCVCDCGTHRAVFLSDLRRGHSQSCGCLRSEQVTARNTIHGMAPRGTENYGPGYAVWLSIHARCHPKNRYAKNYYKRGIRVCSEWACPIAFCKWATNSGYSKDLQIDRIDNNKGYSPDNCRWVSSEENNQNRRTSYWWFIDGIRYDCGRNAGAAHGMCKGLVRSRCLDPRYPNFYRELKYSPTPKELET